MSANTGPWARNGVKRVRLEPLNPSNQQNGSHKGLLERLNSASQEKTKEATPSCPERPRYVDVTAAFFGKQRRPAQEIKSQMPPPQPPLPRPVQQQQPPLQCRQEVRNHDKQRRPIPSESPVAKELRDELAGSVLVESSDLYNNGLTQLRDLYQALNSVVIDMNNEDDHFLALVESNRKKINKLPSEMAIAEDVEHKEGDTTRRKICIGEEVAAVSGLILTLETEVNQLWDAWEAAERDVQTRLAEINGGADLLARSNDCVKDVWKSMAEDMEAFGAEAEGIVEDSHEQARACEKEFSKKIYGAMSALLQQYLLED